MKRIIILTVLFAALSGPALAASPAIPAEYRGEWCQTEGHPYFTPQATINAWPDSIKSECREDDTSRRIKIGSHSYEGWEFSCKPVRVMVDKDPSHIGGHAITFNCYVEGNTGTEVHSFVTTTGTKGIGKRLYIDDVQE